MGYKALYKTLLEDSKRGLARAMRVFASADNFPILVHCIHGKDRTGIVIGLLLMLCDINSEVGVPQTYAAKLKDRPARLAEQVVCAVRSSRYA